MRKMVIALVSVGLLLTVVPSVQARHVRRPGNTPPPVITPPPRPVVTPPAPPTATPAPYPPSPGADCAVTGIGAGGWNAGRFNSTAVTVENHGSAPARCLVDLDVTPAGPGAGAAAVRPAAYQIFLEPGDSATVLFFVRPLRPGPYDATACATSVDPAEQHPADDCATTTVNAA